LNLVTAQGPPSLRQQADICSAFASLYRQQKDYPRALDYARQAYAWREESGDAQLTAEAQSNIALIYAAMGQTDAAIASYNEVLKTFRILGNQESIGNVLLNMGVALHRARRYDAAIHHYQESLAILSALQIPLSQAQICSNLAEAYSETGDIQRAREYWHQGYQLSQNAGLAGQVSWYEALLETYPELQTEQSQKFPTEAPTSSTLQRHPYVAIALELAHCEGQITTRRLREEAGISASTASRYLADMVAQGELVRCGQGRGTYYVCAVTERREALDISIGSETSTTQ
jgi:tetratricopeptide (TPR) repeat protein